MSDLVFPLLKIMAQLRADYTLFFRHLGKLKASSWPLLEFSDGLDKAMEVTMKSEALRPWYETYVARLKASGGPLTIEQDSFRESRMAAVNPRYILRNYLAQRVIENPSLMSEYLDLLTRPFDDGTEGQRQNWAQPAPPEARGLKCSCSS